MSQLEEPDWLAADRASLLDGLAGADNHALLDELERRLDHPDEPAPFRLAALPDDGGKVSARDQLVALALSTYDLGRTEDERPYLVPHPMANDGTVDAPNVALFSGAAKAHLARRYNAVQGKTVGRTPLDEAWTTIEGHALDRAKASLPLRVGTGRQGESVIDIGDPTGRTIVVTASGWDLAGRSPITFRRSKAMLELPEPERGGTLDELFGLLNVAAGNRDLFGAWLCSTLVEHLPHPAPVLRGEQGAAKTTTARAMSRLVDPCAAATQKPPKTDDDWSHSCRARWLVAVDNVSNVPEWWSDAICRTVTGDGWLRRALYTDDDVVVSSWRRCVILNGITLGASLRPDLAERLVLFELERPTEWLTEAEVEARLDDIAPRVLGALLDQLAATLTARNEVEPVRDLRMADFATFLAAYDHANGTAALDDYRRQVDEAFAEALAADPLATAVLSFMADRTDWSGTASALHRALEEHRPHEEGFWPKTAHNLSTTMTRSAPVLRRAGIEWHRPTPSGQNRERLCTLKRVTPADAADAADALSLLVVSEQEEGEGQGQAQQERNQRPRRPRASAADTEELF